MTRALTDRTTFAGVLAQLVRNRCVSGVNRTSRTGLQSNVPVNERPAVRRGIEALIEAGVLAVHGEDVGFTPDGMQFLGYVRRAQGQKIAAVLHDDSGALARILNAIQHDERFDPYRSMDDIITLPARLEGSRTGQHPEVSPMRRLLMGLGLLVLVALILFIFGRH